MGTGEHKTNVQSGEPVMDRLGDVLSPHGFPARQVGDGTSHPEHPVMGAPAQCQPLDGVAEQFAAFGVRPGKVPQGTSTKAGVQRHPRVGAPFQLLFASPHDTGTDSGRPLLWPLVTEYVRWQPRHLHAEVDAIEEGAGNPRGVALPLRWRAPARP